MDLRVLAQRQIADPVRWPGASARYGLSVILLATVTFLIPATARAEVREYTLTVQNKKISIGSDMTYDAWTYNGTVPGPVLRAKVGDLVKIHLVNHADLAHGIDIHAAQIAPNLHFKSIKPKAKLDYSFRPKYPGVFAYHCSSPPIVTHIANGMYGMMIVEPRKGWPKAHEINIIQAEYYGEPDDDGFVAADSAAMMEEKPNFVVFNGEVEKYVDHPIKIKVGELVRIFFANLGPNKLSTFHVIGTIFSSVYRSGNPNNVTHGVQSFEVGPGDAAIFELTVHEPGDYIFVDHAIARPYEGAVGILRAVK